MIAIFVVKPQVSTVLTRFQYSLELIVFTALIILLFTLCFSLIKACRYHQAEGKGLA